ncbi:MAG: 50S ribosomal protein L29 [Omnitrophica WOR_2 bacterium RIFCSPHIGHO2_02_FULL_52_10]|nr:MAG: 50S ribosomal protein L29 [Omnitrophica WOR_2 bacterium RIFCSPHIGHO2_02_FULL_52_10]
MKVKELRGLSLDELNQKTRVFKKELFNLNYQRKMGNVEKPARFRMIKRDIARVATILRERELEEKTKLKRE